jgi:hypothetical protein
MRLRLKLVMPLRLSLRLPLGEAFLVQRLLGRSYPLHMALLPDGRVLNFGTDQTGAQGAQMVYDVWDPTIGNVPNAHTILSNTTATDIFCSGVSLLASGNALVVGGDLTVSGVRNNSQNHVELFSPAQNTLTSTQSMNYARWYGSIITLPNGEKLLLGGENNRDAPDVAGEPTPEVRNATLGWRTLPGISTHCNGIIREVSSAPMARSMSFSKIAKY